MSLHEEDCPCLSCALRRTIVAFQKIHGYDSVALINHLIEVLADLVAVATPPGHEPENGERILNEVGERLVASFAHEIQMRLAQEAGPKEPTTSAVGHA